MISVVVPIYNAGQYLSECLDSLLAQTYKNWEAILVNDGSTDDSGKVCEQYCRIDERFQYIEQINQGVSIARNQGKMRCVGDYIFFMDADDAILPTTLEAMVEAAEKHFADMVVCKYQKISTKDEIIVDNRGKNTLCISGIEALKQFLLEKQIGSSACTKLFTRQVVKDLFFEKNRKMNEDKFFVFEALLHSDSVAIVDEELYCYYTRKNSATQKAFNESWFDCRYFASKIYEMVCEFRPSLEKEARYQLLSSLYFLIRLIDKCKAKSKFLNEYRDIICDIKNISIHDLGEFISAKRFRGIALIKYFTFIYYIIMSIPVPIEPSVRTLRATIPEVQSRASGIVNHCSDSRNKDSFKLKS